jgi:hypothetical protein
MPESIRRSLGGTSFVDTLRAAGQVTFFEGGKLQKGAATLQKYDDGWRMAGETKAK